MSENFKNTSGSFSQNTSGIEAKLDKIQQHLAFLEKKIDALIAGQAQSPAQRSSFPRKDFSKPRRSFGQTEGGGFGRDRQPRERRDFQDGDREGGFGQRRFGHGKPGGRSEGHRREGGFQGPKRKFFGGKKPFPRRGRD